jgi:tight adherence protein C
MPALTLSAAAPAALIAIGLMTLALWVREYQTAARQRLLQRRVGRIIQLARDAQQDELAVPFTRRVLRPFIMRIAESWSRRVLPRRAEEDLARRLRLAGISTPASVFMLARWGIMALALLLGVVLDSVGVVPASDTVLVPAGLAILGYVYWGSRINTAYKKAQEELTRALPEVFDLLAVSVSAGISFESALRRAATRMPGVAGRELGRVVQDLDVGQSRADSLSALARRSGLPELTRFHSLVVQAERVGAGMSMVLHAEAQRVKELRINRAREQAAMVPVKILFPLVMFILPALFIAILGGGLVSMVHSFGSGSL